MKFVYSERYLADIGTHVFRTEKYGEVAKRVVQRFGDRALLIEPQLPSWEELACVLDKRYIEDLKLAQVTHRTARSELPVKSSVIEPFRLAAGGTLLTARRALAEHAAFHIGGGLHHAYPDHGEGFCYINDLAFAAKLLLDDGVVERVLVADLDLHQGNGTAGTFRTDERVFTLSMHQGDNYPLPKDQSDLDVELPNGTGDGEYLDLLEGALDKALDSFSPELCLYQAGADPYEGDLLGGLKLSKKGLHLRDRALMTRMRREEIATAVTLGGGYAELFSDLVDIHFNTAVACMELFEDYDCAVSAE